MTIWACSVLSQQNLSERDQQAAKESFESFRDLVTRFPDSRYSPDSRLRMTYIVNSWQSMKCMWPVII